MSDLTPQEKRRLQTGIYVRCKTCGKPHSSKHEDCSACRRVMCPQCKELKTRSLFVGRICRLCMRKRGSE